MTQVLTHPSLNVRLFRVEIGAAFRLAHEFPAVPYATVSDVVFRAGRATESSSLDLSGYRDAVEGAARRELSDGPMSVSGQTASLAVINPWSQPEP
jgi:hypothetical protein